MAQTIKLRRSATPSAVPTTGQIDLGEVAINTYDGKLFIKKDNGTESIVEVGGGTVTSVSGTGTVNGISLSGTITSSGSLTLGGTLSGVNLTTQVTGTLPVLNGGTGVTTSTGSGNNVLSTGATLTTPVLTVNDLEFTLQDNFDNTKKAQFQLSGISTGTTRTYTLPDANASLAVLTGVTQTWAASNTFQSWFTLSATTQNIALGTSQTTGLMDIGGISQTGIVQLGRSTKAYTLNIGSGATENATTKAINIGSNGVSGSTTNITIGSAVAGASTNVTAYGIWDIPEGLSGVTLNDGYTEEVFAVTGTTPALSPTNGSIQTWTLSGASTPTAGTWAAGQSITLMIDDGAAYTITWTSLAVTWKTDGGSAPTLNTTGETAIQLWKVGTTIYGARVGDA